MAPRSLDDYRQKRDPRDSPEPFGLDDSAYFSNSFVVQQHAARRLHWDLRLAIGGTLVSWAVPKGPSLDPGEKRLAVQTEDHPLDYADFEGVIPDDNYGAGPMILWDRGSYRILDDQTASGGLASGKLDIELFGHKLRGRWALVRIKNSETGKEWLFFKKEDAYSATDDIVVAAPQSVVSGLDIEQRREPSQRSAALALAAEESGAEHAELSDAHLSPMLATIADRAFSDSEWLYEVKYDGYRALLGRGEDGVRFLRSRRGEDFRHVFPEIHLVTRYLPATSFAIDGELIAVDPSGAGSFELLQRRVAGGPATGIQVVLYAFDLIHLCGYDLRSLPLRQRKRILRELLPPRGPVRFADHVDGEGERLLAAARQRELEGIVAKRATSPYRSGERSADWLKLKIPRHGRLVIVGWQPGKGSRKLGSLLVAWMVSGRLTLAGSVGSGLDEKTAEALLARFTAAGPSDFETGELDVPRGATLVRPEVVVEVRYTELTSRGSLRQPVLLAVADSEDWRDCHAPAGHPALVEATAAPTPSEPAERNRLILSNRDKVFWPREGYTKGDLLDYYATIWPHIAPYLRDRPVVMTRYPDGIDGKSFFQRNAPEFVPDWITTARIDDTEFFLCNDLDSLLYVINLGCIPIHMWSSRRGQLDCADWTILDLDPKGAPITALTEVARSIHQLLDDIAVTHFIKTSGQAGLHILIPLAAGISHEQAKMFAELIARIAVRRCGDFATVARPLHERGDRVYIDYLQNGRGKTIAAPLCVRPRDGAPVSMPLRWTQVSKRLRPQRFNIRTAEAQLADGDPLAAVLGDGLDASAIALAVERLAPLLTEQE